MRCHSAIDLQKKVSLMVHLFLYPSAYLEVSGAKRLDATHTWELCLSLLKIIFQIGGGVHLRVLRNKFFER